MRLIKGLIVIFFLLATFLVAKPTLASEGIFELRSTDEENYRCFSVSLLMLDSKFKIIVSCRDLIYPPRANLFNYIMWTTPSDGSKPQKLGTLGVGKANFETKKSFSSLFVTIEKNKNARSPSNQVVMQGNVQVISFLDKPGEATPTPKEATKETETQESSTQEQTTGQKLGAAIKRAGLIIFLGLVVIAGLVFVLTRPKK